jgi:hypothetical protein
MAIGSRLDMAAKREKERERERHISSLEYEFE